MKNKVNAEYLKMLFELKKDIASLKQENNENKKEIKDLKQELRVKDNEIIRLNVKLDEEHLMHEKTIKVLKNDLSVAKERIKKLNTKIKEKDEELKECHKEIRELKQENKKLNNQLAKNSSNSSKPSSTNGFHRVVHSMRDKSEKSIGGQKGHNGTTLDTKKIEKIINSKKENVIVRDKVVFVNNPKLDNKIKYEIDTELSVIIKRNHLKFKVDAPNLSYNLKNDVSYGNNIKSFVSVLNIEHAIPVKRCVDLIRELSNEIIDMSPGSVINILYELQNKIFSFKDNVKKYLLRQEVNHKDETMVYCGNESRWFHVFSNDLATYYYSHKSRGNKADIEKGVLRVFTGTLVHDHMKGLYKFISDDAECNAHILRYLTFSVEEYKRKWAQDMIDLLLEIKALVKEAMKSGQGCLKTFQILEYEHLYDEIISNGFEEFKKDSNKYKDYNGDDMKLLRRLKKYKENHLAFMYDFNVPFDNNLAERDLRMIKAKKKISGCFRTDKGMEAYTDIKSYTSTLKKQKLNIFNGIKMAFNNKPFLLTI